MILPILLIAPSDKGGRGVFTTEMIKAGTIVEISPVLVFSVAQRKIIEQTMLHDYIFEWGHSKRKAALGLGYISMYNHDYNSNCEYEMDYETNLITLKVVRDIDKGEELTINYNAHPTDTTPIWFDAK
jgi:SET domain-containing protein